MTLTDLRTVLTLTAALLLGMLSIGSAALAQQAYSIQPGDVLRIEVIEDPSLNRSVLVPPDGRIVVPLAGPVQASGRSVGQVQADLAALLEPNFAASPSVFVSIDRIVDPRTQIIEPPETLGIFVLGESNKIGRVEVEPGTTLLQFFAEMGGFSKFAATKRVQLRRVDDSGTEQVYVIDYEAIEKGTSKNGSVVLREGDVIVVPQRRLFE